jgi:RimJ/RimL family protein N-acetyltransferase
MTVELRPLDESHLNLLSALQLQDDVWEFIGTLPLAALDADNHVFAIMEGNEGLGFAGLFKSNAAGGDDFELICATGAEVQHRGVAKQACQLVLDWAFRTAKLPRVIACIDESNQPARAIAGKLGMKELGPAPANRIIYVKSRDEKPKRA